MLAIMGNISLIVRPYLGFLFGDVTLSFENSGIFCCVIMSLPLTFVSLLQPKMMQTLKVVLTCSTMFCFFSCTDSYVCMVDVLPPRHF